MFIALKHETVVLKSETENHQKFVADLDAKVAQVTISVGQRLGRREPARNRHSSPGRSAARLTETGVTMAALELKLRRATLYRLIGRYRQGPQTSSLLPWKCGRESFTRFLDDEREDLIDVCIRDFSLTQQRPSWPCFVERSGAASPSARCPLRTIAPSAVS
jgi:hypothetical protein